jgi:cyanuric acid amidohydrolase
LRADVYRFGLKDPSDVSGLREAIEKGVIDPAKIVGVIGKTHGNGLVNDYTRGYLTLCLSQLIGDRLGVPAESVSKRIPFIFSGGVEGVLSPHYTVFTVDPIGAATGQEKSLAIGVAFTPELSISDVDDHVPPKLFFAPSIRRAENLSQLLTIRVHKSYFRVGIKLIS